MKKLHKEILDPVRQLLKKNEIVKKLLKSNNLDEDFLDLICMCFTDDLEVSARTQHGMIYFNINLLDKIDKIPSYAVHEITHVVQQLTGDGPTQGSTDDTYLDNPYEIEGFQNQSKYISDTEGDSAAEKYIEKVLDHHEIPEGEREEKKEDLLRLSSPKKPIEQLKLNLNKNPSHKDHSDISKEIKEFMNNYEENLEKIPGKSSRNLTLQKLYDWDKEYRLRKLKELIEKLSD